MVGTGARREHTHVLLIKSADDMVKSMTVSDKGVFYPSLFLTANADFFFFPLDRITNNSSEYNNTSACECKKETN